MIDYNYIIRSDRNLIFVQKSIVNNAENVYILCAIPGVFMTQITSYVYVMRERRVRVFPPSPGRYINKVHARPAI